MITIFQTPVLYEQALQMMDDLVTGIKNKTEAEAIWFLEHPPVYTFGRRTPISDICAAKALNIPVISSPRGGKMTYHGPGQRIIYMMIDLKKRKLSVHDYISLCYQWIINGLKELGIYAYGGSAKEIGIWTDKGKIAAFGLRVQAGITSHGIALNMWVDLQPFKKISPCGLSGEHITSIHHMGFSSEIIDQSLIAFCPFLP